jgi:hypothetical protein
MFPACHTPFMSEDGGQDCVLRHRWYDDKANYLMHDIKYSRRGISYLAASWFYVYKHLFLRRIFQSRQQRRATMDVSISSANPVLIIGGGTWSKSLPDH